MSASAILSLYLVFFCLYLIFEVILDFLNIKYVRKNRAGIPEFFSEHLDKETYQRSVDYTLTKARFGILNLFYSSLILLAFILSGVFGFIDSFLLQFQMGSYVHGVVFVLGLSFFFTVLEIPFSLYSTFVIEEKFGFNKMTAKLWISDFIKSLVLSVLIISPILLGLFWFMDSTGVYWWVYAFFFVSAIQLLLMYLAPVLIAPLFNKFTPLEEEGLKNAILALAEKVAYKTSGIFLMDGSKRSGHGNAYFTGFGKNKRIVLFDTLIEYLNEGETLAVLAHEMGHEKRRHIMKLLLFSFITTFVAFWILSLLISYLPFYEAFGFERISYHAAIVIFSFASAPFSYFFTPLFSVISRRFEYEADRFAVDAVDNYENLSTALIKLSKRSLRNFTPHPLYSFFHYSHPTLLERLVALKNYGSAVTPA